MSIFHKKTYITFSVLALTVLGVASYKSLEVAFVQQGDQNSFDQLSYLNFNIIGPAPVLSDSLTNDSFDMDVKKFLDRWKIKGASVAVMRDNKLIYAKGYGFANKENEEKLESKHLLRIASASKLVTAIGIMKLVESGQLSLDQKVFGQNGILSEYNKIKDKNHTSINVGDLLNHRGGWSWRDGDFMFQPTLIKNSMNLSGPPSTHDIIEFVLEKRRLRYKPGTQYAYSNFGYMLLGEVIERVSANSYENYIKEEILEPNGIYGMTLSGNYSWDRKPFEVHYYDYPTAYKHGSFDGSFASVPKPYGGNDVKSLGAAGAWIANASQLVKIVSLIDPKNKYPTALSKESMELMVRDNEYLEAFGWKATRGENWWRTGTLSGTSCFLYRKDNGYTYAVILNSSVWMGHRFNNYIKIMMDKAIKHLDTQRDIDLFWQDKPSENLLPLI